MWCDNVSDSTFSKFAKSLTFFFPFLQKMGKLYMYFTESHSSHVISNVLYFAIAFVISNSNALYFEDLWRFCIPAYAVLIDMGSGSIRCIAFSIIAFQDILYSTFAYPYFTLSVYHNDNPYIAKQWILRYSFLVNTHWKPHTWRGVAPSYSDLRKLYIHYPSSSLPLSFLLEKHVLCFSLHSIVSQL